MTRIEDAALMLIWGTSKQQHRLSSVCPNHNIHIPESRTSSHNRRNMSPPTDIPQNRTRGPETPPESGKLLTATVGQRGLMDSQLGTSLH